MGFWSFGWPKSFFWPGLSGVKIWMVDGIVHCLRCCWSRMNCLERNAVRIDFFLVRLLLYWGSIVW
jgi:hypothetical protein